MAKEEEITWGLVEAKNGMHYANGVNSFKTFTRLWIARICTVQMNFEFFKDRSPARCTEASNQIKHIIITEERAAIYSVFWHIIQTVDSVDWPNNRN
jgi:hypothetical protein